MTSLIEEGLSIILACPPKNRRELAELPIVSYPTVLPNPSRFDEAAVFCGIL